jgi:GT2 family glycosyltransferase
MSNTEPGSRVPSLAVVIPTLNRPGDLTITVRTLLDQTALPLELVIVDQSANDESERQVRALYEKMADQAKHVRLRYMRDPAINGLTMARNVALDQNHCDIVLFLDDDVELEPDFVECLMQGYAEDPDLAGISGIITNYRPGGFVARVWQWLFVRGPFRDERRRLYHRADQLRSAGRVAVTRFGGGLMSFRIARTGGLRFDQNLRGPCEGEDVDFCLHLPAGARLQIDPRARLVHNKSATARADEHWNASAVRGISYLYYRNWRHGWRNFIDFAWLMTGFAILVLLACVKSASPTPWKEFTKAARYGRKVGLGRN